MFADMTGTKKQVKLSADTLLITGLIDGLTAGNYAIALVDKEYIKLTPYGNDTALERGMFGTVKAAHDGCLTFVKEPCNTPCNKPTLKSSSGSIVAGVHSTVQYVFDGADRIDAYADSPLTADVIGNTVVFSGTANAGSYSITATASNCCGSISSGEIFTLV